MNDFKIVIPARFASSRFPAKPLADLCGKPLLQHVYECACLTAADTVVIATDDDRIAHAAHQFGATVCMTSADHASGTDRIVEVAEKLGWEDDVIVVNLQGDEPLTPKEIIVQVAKNLHANPAAVCATLSAALTTRDEITNPNVVKVVSDKNGFALYFSRAGIPYDRDKTIPADDLSEYQRHIGIYAYRVGFLKQYAKMPVCTVEKHEALEQLRILWNGMKIHVEQALALPGHGVDTPEDLEQVKALLLARDK
ncbi:MAG: 3-deoxy-manno-octulosonate cytidylyltransferase [Gammaproteobacteria bacterium]|nr:3-deoxy-manno-octulosonate cytidylyltransferase [Gammaproteobacteria bacterium]